MLREVEIDVPFRYEAVAKTPHNDDATSGRRCGACAGECCCTMSCCLCRYVAQMAVCLIVTVLVLVAGVVALVVIFAPTHATTLITSSLDSVITYHCTFSSVPTTTASIWSDPYANVPYLRGSLTVTPAQGTLVAVTNSGTVGAGLVVVAHRDFATPTAVTAVDPTTDANTIYQWLRNADGTVQQITVLLLSSPNAVATAQTTVAQAPLSCT